MVFHLAAQISVKRSVDDAQFDSSVNMSSTPEWDSLNHVQLLSAIEKKFGVEISPDEAFKLTSADRLVQYLHGILKAKQ